MTASSKPARIGLTMRVAVDPSHGEERDALASDWGDLLQEVLPSAIWVPIPNIGERAVELAKELGLTGLVLTGGNDLGERPRKDTTDRGLLRWALDASIPVLGVCRGMQVLGDMFGSQLARCPDEEHVAKTHPIEVLDEAFAKLLGNKRLIVNSYHRFGFARAGLPSALRPLAVCGEWVEAVSLSGKPVVGVMWHPERGRPFRGEDRALFEALFTPESSRTL